MERQQMRFFGIWNMCFGFLGIQIGFELQNNNVSRIFQTLGADIDSLAILWIAAPLTGLLVQPVVGYFSDRTWGPLGRRRPYFLAGAILATLALFVMPNSPALWVAAGMLWVMDASLNITMEPFRAFVGDNLPDRQRTVGYAMQSLFIGLGAVAAGSLPYVLTNWFDIANTAPPGEIPPSVHLAFYVGGASLFLAVLWTVLTTKEYSPEEMAAFDAYRAQHATSAAPVASTRSVGAYLRSGIIWAIAGLAVCALVWAARLDPRPAFLVSLPEMKKELYVLGALIGGFGFLQLMAAGITARRNSGGGAFLHILGDLFAMPKTMRQLAVVQFFSWFAMFAMWIYATPAVAGFHFGATDPTTGAYQDAADWWGVLSSFRNVVTVAAAIAIMVFASRIDRRRLHALNLLLGAAGFGSMLLIKDPALLFLSMVGIGLAWASIVSVPYSILAGAVPAAKMGIYMGIFNIFIVVPQLVAATLLGFLLNTFFGSQPVYALLIAAISFVLGAVATLFVSDEGASTRDR